MIKSLIPMWVLLVIAQTAARAYLFIAYTTAEISAGYKADIAQMFWVGAKYDMRVASIALILPMAIGLVLILTAKTYQFWPKIFPSLAALISAVVIFFTLANLFYFKTFEHSIDVFAFSLIDDDTIAILNTIWQDYPVLLFFIVIVAALVLLCYLYRLWARHIEAQPAKNTNVVLGLAIFLLISALFFLGVRGSAGKFPLRRDNAQISTAPFINNLVPNAMMSLDWAYGDYKKSSTFPPATDEDGRRILSEYFGKPTEPTLEAFMANTKPMAPEAANTRPNVVFLLMESMGSNLSLLQSPDLLGNFRRHWEEDFVFTRFLAGESGTIGAVNDLLVWSSDENISMSRAQKVDFKSNMFKPYIDAGYKVIYITSGSGSWRNLNVFVPNLGADEFIEQNALEELYPDAEESPWGIPDEYMFLHIQTLLEEAEANNQPVLIFALSTTFHPPYRVPAGYTAPAFPLTVEQSRRFEQLAASGGDGGIDNVFGTFRYTADKLGDFMTWLKASPYADHSIVAITGDHDTRSIGYTDPEEAVIADAVPFYLYIPAVYKPFAHYDPLTPGSHKDIWPTIYNLSLPNARYYSSGCDMLAEDTAACFSYGETTIADRDGAFSANQYWQWQEPANPMNLRLTAPQAIETSGMADKYKRYKAYKPMQEWQTNRQVNGEE